MRLGMAIPWTSPFVWTRFVESAFKVERPQGWEIEWYFGKGWCPAARHIEAVSLAKRAGVDYICIFGADQIPPPDLAQKLTYWASVGLPIICALVPSRGYFAMNVGTKPFQPLAWKYTGDPALYKSQRETPDLIELVKADTGLRQVDHIGSGCVAFDARLLDKLPIPWFDEFVNPKTYKRYANMDTRFVWNLAQANGVQAFCDTSIKIKHIHPFEIDDTFQDRFDDWMSPEADSDRSIIQPAVPATTT